MDISGTIRCVVLSHLCRYPAMQPVDLYKLIFQGTLGSEHAKVDQERVAEGLIREQRSLGDGPMEPPVDPINWDPMVVRVHLRPFLVLGGRLVDLADAFTASMEERAGSRAEFATRLYAVSRLARAGVLPFDHVTWDGFCHDLASKDYPAVHHSSVYRRAYRPAYRVIVGRHLARALAGIEGQNDPGPPRC